MPELQVFMVGGAVRDRLLGLPVQDRDWVVVGGTAEALLAQGFQPVGKDFPVFLHPHTGEEYALARTERKTARGYRGFDVHASPEVTLQDDLARRDLTINAMAAPACPPVKASAKAVTVAEHAAQTEAAAPDLLAVIDPFGGRRDLSDKVLRHVTEAFREDPVRILRLARFAARFGDFSVAPETQALMQAMVADGEVDALVPERVWQELSRGLMADKPSRMLTVLRDCGALHRLLPEVDALWGVPQPAAHHPEIDTGLHLLLVLDMAAQLNAPLAVRFACLTHDLGKGSTPAEALPRHIGHEARSAKLAQRVSERWRVPQDCRELADVVAREHGNIHRLLACSAAALVRLLERCDAFRKPQRFADILLACECDARGRLGLQSAAYPQRAHGLRALAAAQSVVTREIADTAQASGKTGPQIGARIHQARVAAVAAALPTVDPA